jgi:hypothetical protein
VNIAWTYIYACAANIWTLQKLYITLCMWKKAFHYKWTFPHFCIFDIPYRHRSCQWSCQNKCTDHSVDPQPEMKCFNHYTYLTVNHSTKFRWNQYDIYTVLVSKTLTDMNTMENTWWKKNPAVFGISLLIPKFVKMNSNAMNLFHIEYVYYLMQYYLSNTCMGVLSEEIDVNPTISLKYIVTQANASGSTTRPCLSSSATDLYEDNSSLFKWA